MTEKLAVYDNGVFTGVERDFDEKPVLPGKPYRKFYAVEKVDPAFDPATQVRSGPTVEEDHDKEIRRYVFAVRDKTAEEVDADKGVRVDRLDLVTFRVLFNHENRIRTLEGRQAVTAEQFKTALKALL